MGILIREHSHHIREQMGISLVLRHQMYDPLEMHLELEQLLICSEIE